MLLVQDTSKKLGMAAYSVDNLLSLVAAIDSSASF